MEKASTYSFQLYIPVSRQIHQVPAIIDPKMVDALSLPYNAKKENG